MFKILGCRNNQTKMHIKPATALRKPPKPLDWIWDEPYRLGIILPHLLFFKRMSCLKESDVLKSRVKTVVNDYFRELQLSVEDLPIVT